LSFVRQLADEFGTCSKFENEIIWKFENEAKWEMGSQNFIPEG